MGPNLTELLGDVLLNFWTKEFGFVADISKAFLRIGLKEHDRNYTKFLWPENPFQPDGKCKVYRFRSVLFGSCSSPFLLCSTLRHHFQKSERPEIGQLFYMDNLQGVSDTEQEAMDIYHLARQECQKANMPLQSWNTNSTTLRDLIQKDYPEYEIPKQQALLGLTWNTITDEMSLKSLNLRDVTLTKRTLLSQN